MEKVDSDHPQSLGTSNPDMLDQTRTTVPVTSHRLRKQETVSHIFTILPDVDTESLLCHACENLASLNVMATNLAGEVEGPQRNITLAIQQLTVLSELLVNRALDNLDPP
ncbi:DUF6124 family protein [Pseudomonas sp. 22105]|jgi:hypothetical protein|uniref:DUF6124 family protein n=1 Tax=Pseudomonas TaxID=286 RepID=UPI000D259FB2|nr:DUF6124 family protein [Pseudomonas glycinae]AWA37448.1 hypothetical protein DBV33_02170 [Pseudomonas fluorescens]